MPKKPMPGAQFADPKMWHPLTAGYLHPTKEGKEFDALCEWIDEEGLQVPIVLLDGLVLDGIARVLACVKLGRPIDFLRSGAPAIQDFYDAPEHRAYEPAEWLLRRHPSDRKLRLPRTKDMREYDEVHDPGRIPAGQFQTLVADPPWDVDHATKKYPTMPVEHITRMIDHRPMCWRSDGAPTPNCKGCGIRQAAAENCHLYLWAINARLRDGLDVMEAWGFRYVTQVTWNKTLHEGIRSDGLVRPDHGGQGQGYRGTTEQLLVGVKGHLPWRTSQFDTQFYAPRGNGHSVKPDTYFWPMIMEVSPGPYLELFARRLWKDLDAKKGDAVWGNQAPTRSKAHKS